MNAIILSHMAVYANIMLKKKVARPIFLSLSFSPDSCLFFFFS